MYHANYVDYQPRHKSRVSTPALGCVVSARIQRRIRSDTVRLSFRTNGVSRNRYEEQLTLRCLPQFGGAAA